MFRFSKLLLVIMIALLTGSVVFGQSLDQAKKMYNEGNYADSKPVFERLVKQSPNNGSYNHWYGVCCFETGDMENAEKHLLVGVKRNVQESHRYLAEIYSQTYRFEEAVEMWDKYIAILTKKKGDTSVYEEERDKAANLNRMVDRVEEIQVIDSMVIAKSDFLSAYILAEESGTLSSFADFFVDSSPVFSSVYMNQKGDRIYYGKPTDGGQMDVYSQSMLLDGWGDEKRLGLERVEGEEINFPFVMPDGITVYYGSTGAGSIGGYDLFVTRLNTNTNTFLAPEQLGMPYNSIFNDYMLVIDESKALGWFVSDRYQNEDDVCVYLFIPNPNRKRLDTDDMSMKRSRAMLHSIRDTWSAGSNYEDLVALAKTNVPFGEKKAARDFVFILQDDLVYYLWDDIKSSEAKNLYQKKIQVEQQVEQTKEALDDMRTKYSQASSAVKGQMKEAILKLESSYQTLLAEPEEWEKKARNAELMFLRKNN